MAGLFQFSSFAQFPSVVHGVATADFGNMSFNWGEHDQVRTNRKSFFDALQVEEQSVVVASLVHGNGVIDVVASDRGRGVAVPKESLEADILVTAEPDTFLFMVMADCLALFLIEPEKRVSALVHAGWRGVDARAPQVAIRYLEERYGCQPAELWVGLGPAVQADSFCFPTQEIEQRHLPNWRPYLKTNGYLTKIDFVGYARDQLIEGGIPAAQIENSGIDTRTDRRFFSHRRSVETQEPEARFGCLIGFHSEG